MQECKELLKESLYEIINVFLENCPMESLKVKLKKTSGGHQHGFPDEFLIEFMETFLLGFPLESLEKFLKKSSEDFRTRFQEIAERFSKLISEVSIYNRKIQRNFLKKPLQQFPKQFMEDFMIKLL